jgi:hypothetical protein
MVKFAGLRYLGHGNRILLQRKAQGLFGERKWNTSGGKMLAGRASGRSSRAQDASGDWAESKRFVVQRVTEFLSRWFQGEFQLKSLSILGLVMF